MVRLNKLKDQQGIIFNLLYSVVAIVIALLLGGVLIYLSGHDPGKAYYHLVYGAFGNSYNLAQTLLNSTPLIFTGLAVAIGFQSGLFNIGGEGQLYWGALATAVTALTFPHLPGLILLPLALLAGALAGGCWGVIPGYLKARTGAHEVITTIMLNYIAILATTFLLRNYFKEAGPVDQTPLIPETARMAELIPFTRLSWAIFLGIAVVVLSDYLLKKTSVGYDIQAVGKNSAAAEYAGISVPGIYILTMGFSGAVAGLTGSTLVLGLFNRFITNFSPGYGFTGIAVAVLGRNRPWGVLLAALLFGALEAGGMSMQLYARIPADLMRIIQGLVILLVAAPAFIQLLVGSLLNRPGGGAK